MSHLSAVPSGDEQLPQGFQRITALPDPQFDLLWNSLIMPDGVKEKLRAQGAANFTVRSKVARSVLPLHGIILLVGPPGTGKTSLGRGLASQIAKSFPKTRFNLVEIDPHVLTSSAMGRTQQAVSRLFSQAIAETGARGPTIVLLDEVETLAADRAKMSLEANPVDIHRATDAVLVQLDALAESHPQLLFIATSNFPQAVDDAFISRCDLVMHVPLPDEAACRAILKDCLYGLATAYPDLADLAQAPQFDRCVAASVGLDGRAIRKAVASALASTPATAVDPNRVTVDQLLAAITAASSAGKAVSEKARPA